MEFKNVVRLAGIGNVWPRLVSVTVTPGKNAVPLMVRVWSPANPETGFGEILVIRGATLTVKYTPVEGAPEPDELEADTFQI